MSSSRPVSTSTRRCTRVTELDRGRLRLLVERRSRPVHQVGRGRPWPCPSCAGIDHGGRVLARRARLSSSPSKSSDSRSSRPGRPSGRAARCCVGVATALKFDSASSWPLQRGDVLACARPGTARRRPSACRMTTRSCDRNSLAVGDRARGAHPVGQRGVTGELGRQVADREQVGDEHPVAALGDRQRHLVAVRPPAHA